MASSYAETWDDSAFGKFRFQMTNEEFAELVMQCVRETDSNYGWVVRKCVALLGQPIILVYLDRVREKLLVFGRETNTAGGLFIREIKQDQGRAWWRSTFPRRKH